MSMQNFRKIPYWEPKKALVAFELWMNNPFYMWPRIYCRQLSMAKSCQKSCFGSNFVSLWAFLTTSFVEKPLKLL